jgi:hypothetical protein
MKNIIIILGLFGFTSVWATEQVDDKLIFEKDTFQIDSPLDTFNNQDLYNRILKINNNLESSGCWRGIIYTWLIDNDSLFIVRAISCISYKRVDLKDLFGVKTQRYFCSWVNSNIEFPSKKIICSNIHWKRFSDDPSYIYEFDNKLEISSGKLIRYSKQDNRKSQIGKYRDFVTIYTAIQRHLAVYPISDTMIEFEMSFDSDENGKLCNIQIADIRDTIIKNSILDALKDFDGLPVYYRYGKLIHNSYKSRFEVMNK